MSWFRGSLYRFFNTICSVLVASSVRNFFKSIITTGNRQTMMSIQQISNWFQNHRRLQKDGSYKPGQPVPGVQIVGSGAK